MTEKPKLPGKKLRIVLDSNALFVPAQFNIDIFEELKNLLNRNFEFILPSPVKKELERIASQGPQKTRRRAEMALKLAQKCTLLETEDSSGSTDDLILEIARTQRYPVFTNDRQLRNRLRDINTPVIYVRQKSRLEIDGRL
jgi:rRNA-processing protein FCF1